MVQAGVRKILNDVVDGPSTISYHNISTETSMYPGALVVKGPTDYDVIVADATKHVIGWLGYASCNGSDKPTTRDTIYADEAEAPVHSKAHYVRAICATGTAINKGDPLQDAADGLVAAGAFGTNEIVAIAAESVDNASVRIWVESRI